MPARPQPGGAWGAAQDMTRLRIGGPGTMKLTTNVKGAVLFLPAPAPAGQAYSASV